MQFSLESKSASLSVGEFAGFTLGPQESGGGPQGLWRAQLGQHWHSELHARTLAENPSAQLEVAIDGRLVHRGWTFTLTGRIDQLLPVNASPDCRAGSFASRAGAETNTGPRARGNDADPALQSNGVILREIKTVLRPLPVDEAELRADYPAYFLQLAAYLVLFRTPGSSQVTGHSSLSPLCGELLFVEANSGLSQTITLTPFDEALVFHQLDALVEFFNLRQRATERRRSLQFRPAFAELRPGQETIQQDLEAAFRGAESPGSKAEGRMVGPSTVDHRLSTVLLFEAPTGYGKTGCVLEFALGQLRAGRFARLIWLTGKSTGQLPVVHTLEHMIGGTGPLDRFPTAPAEPTRPEAGSHPLTYWQVRNKSEHCVNHTFHCVRDGCDFLLGCADRWPQSGLARFYLDETQPHDLDTLRAAGRDTRICPYEITRAALAFHDVWIGDYNYVFAPDNRGLFFERPGFDPAETLLVVDEAHNLPARVAGAHSHRAIADEARLLLAELDHQRAPAPLLLAVESWTRLLASLQPADSLEPALEDEIHETVARLAELVNTTALDYVALGPRHCESLWQFAALGDFLNDESLDKLLWIAREGELEFTCVDAAAAIGQTLGEFGGTILMSATLQPYAEIASACGLDTPRPAGLPSQEGIQASTPAESPLSRGVALAASKQREDGQSAGVCFLHAPTPWRAGAYDVAVDLRVVTTLRERANFHGTTAATIEAMHQAASSQLSAFSSQVSTTRCVAVFFPSYAYAEAVRRALEHSGSVLRVALQPRLPDLAAQSAWVEESLALADALLLVLGSSFAEGIDLLGGRVTHAMVVGPALPEVNAVQKARMASLEGLGRDAAFRRVYQIPGLQKVNQALGRLVRAPGQHAKVLLHCRRFAEPSYAALLAADYQFYREITSESDLHDWLGRTG